MSSSIKAVFTDMDGTLLGPNHEISPYTAAVLKKLKEKGICFIVATGRPYPDVFATIKKTGLQPDYIITSNGARVHDANFEKVLEHNMDPSLVAAIAKIRSWPNVGTGVVEEKKFITNLYREAEWVADRPMEGPCVEFHKDFRCNVIGDHMTTLAPEELQNVHEMWFLGDPAELARFQAYLLQEYGSQIHASFSLPFIVDCVPLGVAKGPVVKEVVERLGLTLDEVACFGDGMNDESMLQIAGKAYIMSNAQQTLKDAVKRGEMIGSNAEDGVAKQLEKMFNL